MEENNQGKDPQKFVDPRTNYFTTVKKELTKIAANYDRWRNAEIDFKGREMPTNLYEIEFDDEVAINIDNGKLHKEINEMLEKMTKKFNLS